MKRQLLQLAFTLLFVSSSNGYYQAEQGRWLNRDPIDEEGGLNLYSILDNDSFNQVDTLGLRQYYKNYGGPSWTNNGTDPDSQTPSSQVGPPYGPLPADNVDTCYLKHDICHKQCKENNPAVPGCLASGKYSDDINKTVRIECKRGCDTENQKCVIAAIFSRNNGGLNGILHGTGSTIAFTFTNRITPHEGQNPKPSRRPATPGRPF